MKMPRVQWGVYGGLAECPYFRKWVASFDDWSLRLHRWYGDDDHRAPHDHPYWFYTFVLWGGYDDISYEVEDGLCTVKDIDKLRRWSLRYRPAEHLHSVQNVRPNTWTLLITGKPVRRWGFWFKGKLIKRDKYFATQGHHPCDQPGEGVRMRPDGSRI